MEFKRRMNRDDRKMKLVKKPEDWYLARNYQYLMDEFGERTFRAELAINLFCRHTCRLRAVNRLKRLIDAGNVEEEK